MEQKQYTVIIKGEAAIRKLETLGRRKGEYISSLIEKDVRIEELEKRIERLERKEYGE